MNTRIANLPQHRLATTLTDLRRETDALKAAQRTSSVSGVLGYQTVSGSTWDATGTVGTDSDTSTINTTFTIQWVGDGTQDIAFAVMAIDLYVNGTDSAHQLSPAVSTWTDGTRSAGASYNGLAISHHTYTYTLVLTTLKAITYYMKVHVYGSCPGTIGVTHSP